MSETFESEFKKYCDQVGISYKQIARRLTVSPSTVTKRVKNKQWKRSDLAIVCDELLHLSSEERYTLFVLAGLTKPIVSQQQQRYNDQKTKILIYLREAAGLSFEQVAGYFGLENKKSVADWEQGYDSPPQAFRSKFIIYLRESLNLRRNRKRFLQVWDEIMVGEWNWDSLNSDEMLQYNLLDKAEYITVRPTVAPFLAPPLSPYPLVGRDDMLNKLKERLFAGGIQALSSLNGLPGVGKTALAVNLAYDREVLEHFQDGVLWAGLGRQGDVLALLGSWARELDISSEELTKLTTVEDRTKAIHGKIGMRHLLLVIDDAWQPDAALAFKVGGANCAYLVTTRIPEVAIYFAGQGVTVVSELSEDEGLALLRQIAPEVVTEELDEAVKLVRAVDGLPLGLILMGNYLRIQAISGQPQQIQAALKRLQRVEERLQVSQPLSPLERHPSLPQGTPVSLMASIAVSAEALDVSSHNMLRALAVFSPKPSTFSGEAAMAVSAEPQKAIDTLCNFGLLETSGLGRYNVHQVIADYAKILLGSELELTYRHATFYLNLMREQTEDWRMIEMELPQIQQAWQTLDGLANEQLVLDYVHAIELFQTRRGLWRERIAWCERGLKAAHVLGCLQEEAWLLNQIAWFYREQGATDKALEYYELALPLRRSSGDRLGEAETLNEIGIIYDDVGDSERALAFLEQGLSIRQELGKRSDEAQSLCNIGTLYQDLGQWGQTLIYFEAARQIYEDLVDLHGQAFVYGNSAKTYLHRGEYDKALKLLEQALQIHRDLGELDSELSNHSLLGSTYYRLGNLKKALEHFEQCLSLSKKLGARQAEAVTTHNIGTLYLDLNDTEQGLGLLEKALPIRREVKDRDGEAWTLMSIGRATHMLGKSEEGINFCEQATAIWHDIHNPIGEAFGLRRLGEIHAAVDNLEQAEVYLQQALVIYCQTSDPADEADTLYKLAMLRKRQDRFYEAEDLLIQAIKIEERINRPILEQFRADLVQLQEKKKP